MRRYVGLVSLCLLFASFAVSAQEVRTPFSLGHFSHTSTPAGERLEFEIANSGAATQAQGRLVVLSVYDTRPPQTLSIEAFNVPAEGRASVAVVWPDPPPVGQARILLVLNDGVRPSMVESLVFWIMPWKEVGKVAAGLILLVLAVIVVPRLRRRLRDHVPSGMIVHIAEADDTVMTLSARFEVTWQDIVKANRLKPPYELKPGTRMFIPTHGLKRPEAPKSENRPTA